MMDLFIAGLGAGVKAAGALAAGKSKAANYNAEAAVDDRQAELETIKADYDVDRQRDKTRRVIGQQQNAYLGQGFQLSGTPLDVAWDSTTESEKDVFAIRFGARVRSENFKAEAANRRALAVDAESAGKLGAIGAGLSFLGNKDVQGGLGDLGSSALKLGSSFFGGG